mmetsp:Transcript_14206/g.40281  ORF Transcript_14206/g.40281 Transcript_14206/m.40281 type:complete len:84 (+) Transcript_14206:51-302(+)
MLLPPSRPSSALSRVLLSLGSSSRVLVFEQRNVGTRKTKTSKAAAEREGARGFRRRRGEMVFLDLLIDKGCRKCLHREDYDFE